MMCEYYVYIMTNWSNRVLYTGVTNDLYRRILEHRSGNGSKFTGQYNLTKLVFFEAFESVYDALENEKRIKAGSRRKKIELINEMNPEWEDLFEEF
ncbi:MAG: GIY-YIG nuclease family protein [Chloroflexota bacterium]|nr:GIY-YIG nuclease family protein [Chloroflexota bacterium]